jgi:hypothetical protein
MLEQSAHAPGSGDELLTAGLAMPARMAAFLVGPTGIVTHWNAVAHRLTGHSRAEAVGRAAATLLDRPAGSSAGRARGPGILSLLTEHQSAAMTTTSRLTATDGTVHEMLWWT